jgi:hypothetical protein
VILSPTVPAPGTGLVHRFHVRPPNPNRQVDKRMDKADLLAGGALEFAAPKQVIDSRRPRRSQMCCKTVATADSICGHQHPPGQGCWDP